MFASLPQRSVLRIAGRVRSVSADAMIDSRSGMTDHLARIQVDDDQLAQAAPGVELTPGMPAEVFITTTRTDAPAVTSPADQPGLRALLREKLTSAGKPLRLKPGLRHRGSRMPLRRADFHDRDRR
jgi:hypothetical protein